MMARPTRHFKVGFKSEELLINSLWEGDNDYYEYDYIIGLFSFVRRGMQFSYDDCVIDESAVEQLPNGTWTGLVGRLNRSEIDYAPAAFILTEEGWDAAAYNYPYAIDELTFATRKPEYFPETMALFRTLSLNVWSSLLACTLLVTLACFVAMKHRCTLGDILLHVLAIGLNQEGNLVPRRAGEVLLLSTWLGAMAVFTFCFKSVLLSFLAFPPMGGVRTVPELAAAIRAGQYIACSVVDEDFARYLQRSPVDDLRVIGESMLKNPPCFLDIFLYESPKYPMTAIAYRRSDMANWEGDFYVSKDNMGSLYFATAVNKGFWCKDEMDMLVHRFMAAGISQKIDSFIQHATAALVPEALKDSENTLRVITMTDLAGAFILLVAGHCLSVCVLIVECWMKRRERRHPSTRTTQSGGV